MMPPPLPHGASSALGVSRALGLSLILAAALAAGACPKAGTDPAATTATAAPTPPFWMSIKDGKLHSGLDEAPLGLYVGGDKDGAAFAPGGDIEGEGPVGAAGEPGWLDLKTGTFVKKSEPQPPPPFVEGAMTPSGFSPARRRVAY